MSDALDKLIDSTPAASADELDALIDATPARAAPGGVVGGQHGIASKVGPVETYVNDAVDILPGGRPLVNAITAGITKLKSPNRVRLGPAALAAGGKQAEGAPGLVDTYRNVRGAEQVRSAVGDRDNPIPAYAGKATGLLLSLMAPLPKFVPRGGTAASTGAKLLSTGKTAAAYGTFNALTNGRADLTRGEVGQALKDVSGVEGFQQAGEDFRGGHYGRAALDVAGAGIPGALVTAGAVSTVAPLVSRGTKAVIRKLVRPTDDAQALLDKGVPLTLGQMNPAGTMNRIESAGEHVAGAGTELHAQREAALREWQQLAMKEGAAPGAPPPMPTHDLGEQLGGLYEGFEPAYGHIREQPATPVLGVRASGPVEQSGRAPLAPQPLHEAIRPTMPELAAAQASADDEAVVRRFLDNQSSKLANVAEAGGEFKADSLMAMRSDIRAAIRKALSAGKYERAELFQNAEDKITQSLEQQLSGEDLAALRATDAAYAKHKTLTEALYRAGDSPHGFTPSQLQAAVKGGVADKGAYARGSGGDLRELARLGRSVFDAPLPPTGAKALVAGHHGIKVSAPIAAALNNMDAVRTMAAGRAGTGAMSPATTAHALALANALRRQTPVQLPEEEDPQ